MQVWVNDKFQGPIYLPYHAHLLNIASDYILANSLAVMEAPVAAGQYEVRYSPTRPPIHPDIDRTRYLTLPQPDDGQITALARTIFAHQNSFSEKKEALLAHLNQNYTYRRTSENRSHHDPLSSFLFETHSGHCQHFATAAAVLLRCADIPTRYVEGFIIKW